MGDEFIKQCLDQEDGIENYYFEHGYSYIKACEILLFAKRNEYGREAIFKYFEIYDEFSLKVLEIINEDFLISDIPKFWYKPYLHDLIFNYCSYFYKTPSLITENSLDNIVKILSLDIEYGNVTLHLNSLNHVNVIFAVKRLYNTGKIDNFLKAIRLSKDDYDIITEDYREFLIKYHSENMFEIYKDLKPKLDTCNALLGYIDTLKSISIDLPDQDIIVSRDFLDHLCSD